MCCGQISAGASDLCAIVDLRNSNELRFQSYRPPCLAGVASFQHAFEFYAGPQGHRAPLLGFTLSLMWPTMCDEHEWFNSCQAVHSLTENEASLARIDRHVQQVVREYAARLAASAIGPALSHWLSVIGLNEARAVLEEALQAAKTPSSSSAPSSWSSSSQGDSQHNNSLLGVAAPSPLIDVTNYSAETIAEQITLVDHRLLSQIRVSELLDWYQRGAKETSGGLAATVSRFNDLSAFVVSDIIACHDQSARNRRLKHWCEVQKQLFNLNNFSACFALHGAFGSVPIVKLASKDALEFTRNHRRWLEYFEETMLKNNKAGYRRKLLKLVEAGDTCIPFLGMAKSDLVFLSDGNPDLLDGGPLINFSKRNQMAKVLWYVHQFSSTPYSALKEDSDLLAFFLHCRSDLNEKKCDELVDAILGNRSVSSSSSSGFGSSADGSVISQGSTPPPSLHPSLTMIATCPSAVSGSEDLGEVGRFLPLLASPPSSPHLGAERRRDVPATTADRKARLARPRDRTIIWNQWVASFIDNRRIFLKDFSRSPLLEECINGVLVAPLLEEEIAILETLLVFVLLPTANVPVLIDLLRYSASSDPDVSVRESICLLFSSLKVYDTLLVDDDAAASSRRTTNSGRSFSDAAILPLDQAFSEMDSGLRELSLIMTGARSRLDCLLNPSGIFETILSHFSAMVPQLDAQMRSFALQSEEGVVECRRLVAQNRFKASSMEKELEEVVQEEEELRLRLAKVIARRQKLEESIATIEDQSALHEKEQAHRSAILEANRTAAGVEKRNTELILEKIASVKATLPEFRQSALAVQEAWRGQFQERLSSFGMMLQRLYDEFGEIQQHVGGLEPTTEKTLRDVAMLNHLCDTATALLTLFKSAGNNQGLKLDRAAMGGLDQTMKDIVAIRGAVNAVL